MGIITAHHVLGNLGALKGEEWIPFFLAGLALPSSVSCGRLEGEIERAPNQNPESSFCATDYCSIASN